MGYRFDDKPFDPEEHLNVYPVRANAILNLSFGCYYMRGHDAKYHDHIGWPNPNNPDHICQMNSNGRLFWPYNDKTVKLEEIDLVKEGYVGVLVTYEPTGITIEVPSELDPSGTTDMPIEAYFFCESWIDQEDPNIIRLKFIANFFDCGYDVKEPIDVVFTLYVYQESNEPPMGQHADTVEHGIIRILPASPFEIFS